MGGRRHFQVLIIGSGFSGLGAAVRIRKSGFDDFAILERATELGGTWRDNTYPGCACDVPSHLYSYSFAPNPGWSRTYSPQPEILEYLRDCARRFGLEERILFGHDVRSAAWDEDAKLWRVETSKGELTASALIAGLGFLSEPAIPSFPGLEAFRGRIFHSARWDREYDLRGKRVAVIGTGASAAQFIPRIQPSVAKLHVFQRTPHWVIPHSDRSIHPVERALYRRIPGLQRLLRAQVYLLRELTFVAFRHPALLRVFLQRSALWQLKRAVPDPALREKLTPRYTIGCKRIILSDDYYPALARGNVEVVTAPIRELRASSILTEGGGEREVDAIIFATGFQLANAPIFRRIRGRGGVSLADSWQGSPSAYLGTTVAGFPNFFLPLGPGTGLGHSSVLLMIESQLEHIARALEHMRSHGLLSIEPREEAQRAFVERVDRRMAGTVWATGNCASWYIDRTGRISALWPDSVRAFRRRLASFDPRDFHLSKGAGDERGSAAPIP